MFSLILLNLTFKDIVTDIPHDAAAMVVYFQFTLLVGFIWYGSRPGSKHRTEPTWSETSRG